MEAWYGERRAGEEASCQPHEGSLPSSHGSHLGSPSNLCLCLSSHR